MMSDETGHRHEPRLLKNTVTAIPGCEICGSMYAENVKTSCFTLQLCPPCRRDWDDEVNELSEMRNHCRAVGDIAATRDAIVSGICSTASAAKTELRIVLQEEYDAQVQLRAALKVKLIEMKAAKEKGAPDPFDHKLDKGT